MSVSHRCLAAGLGLTVAVLAAPAARATSQDTAVRVVTQEGLAIAMASSVLQSQLHILIAAVSGTVSSCGPIAGGGSEQLLSRTIVSKGVTQVTATVYFDTACTKPYIAASAKVTETKAGPIDVAETATYTGPTGTALGTMTLHEIGAFSVASGLTVIGAGLFTPTAKGAPKVTLGLQCAIPESTSTPPFPCTGGIAQNFRDLGMSIASLTQLTLQVGASVSDPVTFQGSSTQIETGAFNALRIGQTGGTALTIDGTGTAYGATTTATGGAGAFGLFPPTPTGWTVTDSTDDVVFSIAVLNDTTRRLAGTVTTISSGTTLATFTLDRSGSGRIVYTGGKADSVSNWLLRD